MGLPLMDMSLLGAMRKLSVESELTKSMCTAELDVHATINPHPIAVCLLFITP
jgi:hypothetical protein